MGSYPWYRRRNYFIKKGLQGRFVLGFSVLVLSGFLLNLLGVYFLIDRELAAGLYKVHLKIRTTSELALPVIWRLGIITVPAIVVIAALIGYRLTSRIEIPLLGFMDAMRKTGEGDFTRRLGDGFDNLREVSDRFNRLGARLERSFCTVKAAAEALEGGFKELDHLATRPGGPDREELVRTLEGISEERNKAAKEISRFKV